MGIWSHSDTNGKTLSLDFHAQHDGNELLNAEELMGPGFAVIGRRELVISLHGCLVVFFNRSSQEMEAHRSESELWFMKREI